MKKILSIDVGMKNLAYCLFEINDYKYSIIDWDVIDLCKQTKVLCMGKNQKGGCCVKNGKYFKSKNYYCKIHAKKYNFKIPTKEYNIKKIKKLKINQMKTIAMNYDLSYNKTFKKKNFLELFQNDLSNNYFNTVDFINTTQISLVTYGKHLKEAFNSKTKNWGKIDLVLVENQIGPLALRMKTLQGMIMQHFIEKDLNVLEISPSNKLKEFLGNKKTTYAERKKESIKITQSILLKQFFINKWTSHFNTHKKQDDLADSFLQGLWYFKKEQLIK